MSDPIAGPEPFSPEDPAETKAEAQADTPPEGPPDTPPVPEPKRRLAMAFVVAVVAVDAIGIGLVMPVIPDLLAEIAGLSAAEAAPWGGWMGFAYAASIFLFGPLMGDLSDRYGRRPVLLAAMAALTVDYLIAAVAPSLWLLVLARALAGVAGATYATATACVADLVPPERRAAAFGLVGAGFGVGFILGPTLGGLLGALGPRAPFLAAAACCASMALFGLFALPETLPRDRRRAFRWRGADPFSALRGAARLPGMAPFLAALALFELGFGIYPSIWSFYLIELHGWSTATIGISMGVFGVGLILSQALLLGPMTRTLGERTTILTFVAIFVLACALFAAGPPSWAIFAAQAPASAAAAAPVALAGMLSARAAEDAQGRLQGVLAGVQGLSAAFAPPIFTAVFAVFAGPEAPIRAPGAPFALAAVLGAAALILLLRARMPAMPRPASAPRRES